MIGKIIYGLGRELFFGSARGRRQNVKSTTPQAQETEDGGAHEPLGDYVGDPPARDKRPGVGQLLRKIGMPNPSSLGVTKVRPW
jgi:hypothetical protein